jgi:hypothetical protein
VEEVAFGDIGLSRNEGTRLAHGRFLSFLDGDNLWGEQWLRAAHEAARTPAVSEDIVWHPEHLYIFREAEFDRMPEAVASLMRASDTPGFNAASLLFGSLWSANGFARRAPYPLSISCRRSQPRDRHRGLVLEFGNPLGWGETSGCAEGRASSSTEESRVARPAKRHRSFAAAATSNIDMGPIALKHVPAEPFAAHLQRQHAT